MATKSLVTNGSDNCLLPDGTKLLPETMLTNVEIFGIHPSAILQKMHKTYLQKYNLTDPPLVPHICVSELGQHWFR